MKIPFQYGTIAERENFIDRYEERRQLKAFLGSGINVMLISPRRWGKSSLVKASMSELSAEEADVRVCHLDAYKIFTEDDFYAQFATTVISGVSSTIERRMADVRRFIQNIKPSVSLGGDPNQEYTFNLNFPELKESPEEILSLPERMAENKHLRVIVCIDEFQQLANLSRWPQLAAMMRSVWQHQQHVTYCLFGSKRHMMEDIFNNSNSPFYRFGQVVYLEKIDRSHWLSYIIGGFGKTEKHISEALAGNICDLVECHSWYVQQLSALVWANTNSTVTDDILQRSLQTLLDTNEEMFRKDLETLTASQVAMLKAIAAGESHFNAAAVVKRYGLGAPRTITNNKNSLLKKDLVERQGSTFAFVDPVFALWFKREYNL